MPKLTSIEQRILIKRIGNIRNLLNQNCPFHEIMKEVEKDSKYFQNLWKDKIISSEEVFELYLSAFWALVSAFFIPHPNVFFISVSVGNGEEMIIFEWQANINKGGE